MREEEWERSHKEHHDKAHKDHYDKHKKTSIKDEQSERGSVGRAGSRKGSFESVGGSEGKRGSGVGEATPMAIDPR